MERILLLATPADDEYDPFLRNNVAEPPLGLLYLWTALEQSGLCKHVSLVDAYLDPALADELPKILAARKITQLWISLMSTEGYRCLGNRLEQLRALFPRLKITGGGALFRRMEDQAVGRFLGDFDLIVVGDADLEIEHILRAEGIYRCRPIPSPLEVPYPNRSAVDLSAYFASGRTPHHVVIGARGCVGTCSFCSISCRKPYLRAPREVITEIRYLHRATAIACFSLIDDVMAFSPKRFSEYERHLGSLRDNVQLDVSWRIDRFSPQIARRLVSLGVRVVRFGVESIDPQTQALLGKSFSPIEVKEAARLCRENGLSPCFYFMFGFATDTERKIADLIDFMTELSADIPVPPYLGIIRILEGTPLKRLYTDRGWLEGGSPKRGVPIERLLEVLGGWRHRFAGFFETGGDGP